MAVVEHSLRIPLPPADAFDVFVGQMNTWWPRQGVFPYSFAPGTTRPLHIQFEPHLAGRYYETFADGTEYVIGAITIWQPPTTLAYSWRDPTWPGETLIQLRFETDGDGSRVTYAQAGFAAAGVPELAAYYQIGCEQTLAAYAAHCRALRKLQMLTGAADQADRGAAPGGHAHSG